MRVHLGSDHAGLDLKAHLTSWLTEHGYEPVDHGPVRVRRGRRLPGLLPARRRGRRHRPQAGAGQLRRGHRRLGQRRADRRQQGPRDPLRAGLVGGDREPGPRAQRRPGRLGRRPDAPDRGHDPVRRGLPHHAVQRGRAARAPDRHRSGATSAPASCRRCRSLPRTARSRSRMPEGHTLHRLATALDDAFAGHPVRVSSPQGRFAESAALLDGRTAGDRRVVGQAPVGPLRARRPRARPPRALRQVRRAPRRGGGPGPGRAGAAAAGAGGRRRRPTPRRRTPTCAAPPPASCQTPEQREALVARLGPDPLRPDADPDLAWHRIRRSRAPIAGLLMDQSRRGRDRERLPRRAALPAPRRPVPAGHQPAGRAAGGRCGTTWSR